MEELIFNKKKKCFSAAALFRRSTGTSGTGEDAIFIQQSCAAYTTGTVKNEDYKY